MNKVVFWVLRQKRHEAFAHSTLAELQPNSRVLAVKQKQPLGRVQRRRRKLPHEQIPSKTILDGVDRRVFRSAFKDGRGHGISLDKDSRHAPQDRLHPFNYRVAPDFLIFRW